jgi:transitional endoplasmic reticulum ATPase
VAGLTREKQLLEAAVLRPVRVGEGPCAALGGGVLLLGPSGAGKTLLAAALAAESGLPAVVVRGPDVLSSVVGESEKRVALLFARARQSAPCLVLLDQLEAIAPAASRESLTQTQGRLAAALAAELDDCPAAGVLAVATAGALGACDAAVVRRFDLRLRLPPPSREQAALVLAHGLGRIRNCLEPEQLALVAERCGGLSPAACAAVSTEAAMACLRRCIAAGRAESDDALVVELGDVMAAADVFL